MSPHDAEFQELSDKWKAEVESLRAQRDQARLENIALTQLLRTYDGDDAEDLICEDLDTDASISDRRIGSDDMSNPWMFLDIAEAVRLSAVSWTFYTLVMEWTPLWTSQGVRPSAYPGMAEDESYLYEPDDSQGEDESYLYEPL